MNKKKLTLTLVFAVLLVVMLFAFSACSFQYGDPDKLGIGSKNIGEKILLGLQVAGLGIGLVFVVLIILIGIIILFKYATQGINKLIAGKQQDNKVEETSQLELPVVIEDTSDEEEIAAIMAAINMYYDSQEITYKSNLKFRVRSIKEIK